MSEVRAFFDRWQRLEEAKAEISDDLKELFAEAKATGFNTKALRVAFRAKVKAENETDDDRELAAIVDLYLAEIDGPRARPASARVEKIEEFAPKPTEALSEVALPTTDDDTDLSGSGRASGTGSAGGEGSTPSGAPEIHERPSRNAEASPEAGPQAEASLVGTDAGTLAGHEGRSEGEAASADLPTHSEDDFAPPAFLNKPKTAADYRPHCLHPEACGSSGLHHCYSCEKALERESEAA